MRDDDYRPERRRLPLRTFLALAAAGLVVLAGSIAAKTRNGTEDAARGSSTPSPRTRAQADTSPPTVTVDSTTSRLHPFRPYVLRGRVNEAVTLRIDGKRVQTDGTRFRKRFERPPRAVTIAAVDTAGNRAREVITLRHRYVGIRGVHVSAFAWATRSFRSRLEKLIRRGHISTVELDLKDESGTIGYRSKIPLAKRIGASRGIYDLEETIERIHDLGARVVGRLVAFRDPIMAEASWKQGHRQRVIQTRDRNPYAGYGGFTNFADETVRRYNQAIAVEAARAGIDDVLYDYIRRPDGPLRALHLPGLKGRPEKSIASFVAETRRKLVKLDTRVGVSVYGIASTRPQEIAQDITKLAHAADYISPMVYPSHWARGEYGVRHPNAQPYKIVKRSLRDFKRRTRGTGARIIPWLQDFSLGIRYGRAQVCDQMRAARDVGIEEWLLWDPHVTYTIAPQPRFCRN